MDLLPRRSRCRWSHGRKRPWNEATAQTWTTVAHGFRRLGEWLVDTRCDLINCQSEVAR